MESYMHKLYHYVHCPYCIRIRMVLGYFRQEYHSIVLPYDDEQTPISLAGKKMLPIMEFPDGPRLNESLLIVARLDPQNRLDTRSVMADDSLTETLAQIAAPVHKLAMPYWMYTPEFGPQAREYFRAKKQAQKGRFEQLVANRKEYSREINHLLDNMGLSLNRDNVTLRDILIAAHLWGLYIVPEFQFSPQVHHYLQSIAEICHFDYHGDFWK